MSRDYLLELFGNPCNEKTETCLRPPFGYPGGKSKLAPKIVELLPQSGRYVEVFGGSGAVLLAKSPSKMEVFNDRYSGVVAFYRCMRDHKKMMQLKDLVDTTIHSKEDFYWCKDTWEKCTNDVDRAFRWFYMQSYSFGTMGRNWGFGKSTTPAGKIRNRIPGFEKIHKRFKKVQVDNADWKKCIEYYDAPDTVFYLDPPYIEADNRACYAHSGIDYLDLVHVIKHCEGFVALSGYPNPIYDNQDFWTDRHVFDHRMSIQSEHERRQNVDEVLWIKEANNA